MPYYARWEFWLYLAAWVPYTGFVLLYATRSPWFATPIGRSLLLSKGVIAALLSHLIALYIWPDYYGHDAVRVLVVGGGICAGWYQAVTLFRLQRADRRNDRNRISRGDPVIPQTPGVPDHAAPRTRWQWLQYTEPARIRAIVTAVVALAAALGIVLPFDLPGIAEALLTIAAVLLPLIQGEATRAAVVSPQRADLIAAGRAHTGLTDGPA